MAHNDYVRDDGIWCEEFVPCPRDGYRFDIAQFKAINADDGGAWNPVKPIAFGGIGVTARLGAHLCSGGAATSKGGRVQLLPAQPPAQLAAPYARVLRVPFRAAEVGALDAVTGVDVTPFLVESMKPNGLQLFRNAALLIPIPPRALHSGATLGEVTVRFFVGQDHPAVPAVLPTLNVWRLTKGTVAGALLAASSVVLPTPASGSDYFAGGAMQSLTLVCTQNNVLDATQYQYVISLIDENGANALTSNLYVGASLALSGITSLAFE
jgi:hypothetical protein